MPSLHILPSGWDLLTLFTCQPVVTKRIWQVSPAVQATHFHSWKSSSQGVLIGHWHLLEFLCHPQIAHSHCLVLLLMWLFHGANVSLAKGYVSMWASSHTPVHASSILPSSSSCGTVFFLDGLYYFQEKIQFHEGWAQLNALLLSEFLARETVLASHPLREILIVSCTVLHIKCLVWNTCCWAGFFALPGAGVT